jgi:diguanylate cyclase (GGDEF)-like protein
MVSVSPRPIHVLLVEQDPRDLAGLRRGFAASRGGPLEVEWVSELTPALERLSQGGIDAVLLDLMLRDSEGPVTFERANAFAPDVPIVVFTDVDDQSVALSTLQGGAQDYLVKSEVSPEMVARCLRYAIERHRLLAALKSLSLIDDLTNLYNRRGFSDLGEQYLKLARRTSRAVALVCLGLDRFKVINESLGHHIGDRVLLRVADILKATFRRSDIIARVGGDEFAVLAVEAGADAGPLSLTRLRERVDEFNHASGEPYQIAFSVGMSRQNVEDRGRLDDLLIRTLASMQEEKRNKRRALVT